MPQFILHRADTSIGMSFNDVAARIKQRDDVKMLEKQSIDSPVMGMIVIEAPQQTALDMRGTFPGWTISPNYKTGRM